MKSAMFDMNSVFCINTGASKKLVVIDENLNKSETLLELCKRIVELEYKGYMVSGVTELNPDGTTPRVKFRNTKEYKEAKSE